MKCDEARILLPEYAGEGLADPRDLEAHLATCSSCPGELAHYRDVLGAVRTLADDLEHTPAGFTERVMLRVGEPQAAMLPGLRRFADDRRVRYALASLGGAVLGAVAIGLLWKRSARRVAAGSA